MLLITGIIISVILLFVCVFKWRLGLAIIFVWMCLDAGIRRFIVDNVAIYFIKDILLLFVYLGFYIEIKKLKRSKIIFPNRLNLLFLFLVVLSFIHLFNPALPKLTVGLIGIKLLLFYIPLFYIGYYYFEDKMEIISFMRPLLILSILLSIFGIIQFVIGPAASIGKSPAFQPWLTGGVETGLVKWIYKPEATFGVPGIYAWYLHLMLLLSISMLMTKELKVLSFLTLVLALLGMIIASVRSAYLLLFFEIMLIVFLTKNKKLFLRIAAVFLIIFVLLSVFLPRGILVFADRILSLNDEFVPRVMDYMVLGSFYPFLEKGVSVFGSGPGMAALGTRYLLSSEEYFGIENFMAKMVIELGILGGIVFILIMFVLIKTSYEIIQEARDENLKLFVSVIFVFQIWVFIIAFLTNILDHAIISIYFWFFSGVCLKIPKLLGRSVDD